MENTHQLRSYGRRAARMTQTQRQAYHNPSERQKFFWHALAAQPPAAPSPPAPRPGFQQLCAKLTGKEIIIEIGSGMGAATIELAKNNADKTYLAIEVYQAGIAKLLWAIDRYALNNLYILEGDARLFLNRLCAQKTPAAPAPPETPAPPPPPAVSGIHIFFPDPWPKKRHHKRRLLSTPVMRQLLEILLPLGYCAAVTDNRDYAETITHNAAAAGFTLPDNPAPTDGNQHQEKHQWAWRPPTSYEKKALRVGSQIHQLLFRKPL